MNDDACHLKEKVLFRPKFAIRLHGEAILFHCGIYKSITFTIKVFSVKYVSYKLTNDIYRNSSVSIE